MDDLNKLSLLTQEERDQYKNAYETFEKRSGKDNRKKFSNYLPKDFTKNLEARGIAVSYKSFGMDELKNTTTHATFTNKDRSKQERLDLKGKDRVWSVYDAEKASYRVRSELPTPKKSLPVKIPGTSISMFTADGETITSHNNARNISASYPSYGSKGLTGISANVSSSTLSNNVTSKLQLGSTKANPSLPKNIKTSYGNVKSQGNNVTSLNGSINSLTPKSRGTHPNTGRPVYDTFKERQAARQRDIADIKKRYKNTPKNMQMLSYLPNKEGETSGIRIPYSLALEEKLGLVRNRRLQKSVIAARRDATAETKAPKPTPSGISPVQEGSRKIPNPEEDWRRTQSYGPDGEDIVRPAGSQQRQPTKPKHDPNHSPRDITESTHYNKEQDAKDHREQAAVRASDPNFKRFDPAADARVAAVMGLNTTIGSEDKIQSHLDLGGRGEQAIPTSNEVTTAGKNGINQANQVNNPLASTSSRSVLPPIYTNPETDGIRTGVTNPSLEEMSNDFDRTNSAIKPLAPELAGISNLGEKDANALGRAYNQSLINNRIGKRAGFEDLEINDLNKVDGKTGEIIAGKALSNHTTASVLGYGGRSITSGYGMGWGNAWRASRKDHAIRAVSVINPLSFGNMSIAGEALGFTTTLDQLKFKANPSVINRIAAAAPPLFAGGTVAYGMYDNQDLGELTTNLLLPAVALPSARVGIAIGGMVTPAKTAKNLGVIRGLGLAGGAVGGFVVGAAAVMAASGGIRDINSNTSSMRSMSKKIATSEIYVQDNNSRQSLTARQISLNKLARSGLNDRALLLSNEAASLKGIL